MELWFVAVISAVGGMCAIFGAYLAWKHMETRKGDSGDAAEDDT